jgi:hypothetical protein
VGVDSNLVQWEEDGRVKCGQPPQYPWHGIPDDQPVEATIPVDTSSPPCCGGLGSCSDILAREVWRVKVVLE